jgi:hypothetical protein
MQSVLDSGYFVGPSASIKQIARQCDFSFPLSLRQLVKTPMGGPDGCPFSTCVRLHIKEITRPTVKISTMLSAMRQVYGTAGIAVIVASRETLTGPTVAALDALDVGGCSSSALSTEQTQLYQNRNNVGNNEIAVYFTLSVTETSPKIKILNGCASRSAGSAAIAQIASQWTLAHEVGHVLNLDHITGEDDPPPALPGNCKKQDTTRLMTGCSTSNITGIPTLSQDEIITIMKSPLLQST